MDIKQITSDFSVVAQLQASDLAAIQAAGFKTVINNRPDAEDQEQPLNQELAQQAQSLGLNYHYLPIIAGQVTDQVVADFEQLLKQAQGPVLAFCRSGNRCLCAWSLVTASTEAKPYPELQAIAQQQGFDLTNLQSRIEQRATNG